MPSAAIESFSYERESAQLTVRFRSGAAYRYLAVPIESYLALCAARSKGAFINREIKPRFDCEALGGPTPIQR
jgi:hypothetical protein